MKAYFKNCDIKERAFFKDSNCIMPISVGQYLPVHEDNKLLATVKLANRAFKRCTLMIDDVIQRHTLKIFSNEPDSVLLSNALYEGDAWLKRNQSIYENLNIDYNISRWSDWLKHPAYIEQKEQVNNLYQTNSEYKSSVNLAITNYIERAIVKKGIDFDLAHARQCCLDYLLEECTVMCLWALEDYDCELYPSGRNPAMQATYEKIIKKDLKFGKLVSVSLYFRK